MRIFRCLLESGAIRACGRLKICFPVQKRAQVEQGIGVGRIKLDDSAEAILRFREARNLVQAEAEVVERRQVLGRGAQRAPIVLDGAGEVADRLAGIAQILEGVGVLRGQGA